MDNDLISRQEAIAYAISGLVRTEDGEKWIRVSEVRDSLKALPSAKQEPKWIEIYEGQENLPPLGIDVLLCVINGSMDVGYLMKDEEGLKWKVCTWYNDFLDWDAWKYLPEPWKGE